MPVFQSDCTILYLQSMYGVLGTPHPPNLVLLFNFSHSDEYIGYLTVVFIFISDD